MIVEDMIKECEMNLKTIYSFFKNDIETMLANRPINRFESEKAKYCIYYLDDFLKDRFKYFDNDSVKTLIESVVNLKGFFQILDAFETEKIESFKIWMRDEK